jgi:zinc protease
MCAKKIIMAALLVAASMAAFATPKIEHWTLANGARVYFVKTHDLPMVQFRAVFDAGSIRDTEKTAGTAALTAVMLNEGAAELNADAIAAGFENVGAEFGSGSDRELANVDLRSLSDPKLLQPALAIYTQLLTQPTFPAENLERERARHLLQLQKNQQSPGAIIDEAFFASLYAGHPLARHALGNPTALKTVTREDLSAFHKRFYTGANAWFVIVGDLSTKDAKRIASETVGRLPRGEPAPALPGVALRAKAETQAISFPATQSHIRLGLPGFTRLDPDYYALYVGNYILGGGGLVSRLSDEVREKRGFSYSVYSYVHPMRQSGPFVVGLQTENAKRTAALKVVRDVIARFVADGPTDAELAAAKKHLTGSFALRLDSNRKIADNLAAIAFYGLPLTYLDDFIPRVEAVTAAQIREAFKRRIDPNAMLTVTVGGG